MSRNRPEIRRPRCPRCEVHAELCFCARIPRIETRTRIVIVMHRLERKIRTRTAELAAMALPRCEIHLRGVQDSRLDSESLLPAGEQGILLFPSEGALELSPDWVRSRPGPLTLIVPDGSWRQATKIGNREPGLRALPRVKLPQGKPSEYRLRKEPRPESVSTFEAIARALGILESPEIQLRLETVFRMMVDRRLWSAGKLKPDADHSHYRN